MKLAVSVTTVSMTGSVNDWRSQVGELKALGIVETAVFPTALKESERYELYRTLVEAGIVSIPLLHLITEMKPEEIGFLADHFEIGCFNLHSTRKWPLHYDYSEWASKIFLENGKEVPDEEELGVFAGLCIDFSHWHNERLVGNELYCEQMNENVKRFPIGVSHVSVIKKERLCNPFRPEIEQYDSHLMQDVAELDYLGRYVEYLAPINAIELENPISDQLRAWEYIESMMRH